tara:strand:- start:63438 stop:63719 length:282 start_codon:yes stop_codon:yes gene_type:complete
MITNEYFYTLHWKLCMLHFVRGSFLILKQWCGLKLYLQALNQFELITHIFFTLLNQKMINISNLYLKSWMLFANNEAVNMYIVVTICGDARDE